MDIVFVHGLTGDPFATWSCPETHCFWPKWLQEDLDSLGVYTLGYPANIFAKWAKKEMDLFERAGNALEQLAGMNLGYRPIVFVAHSLGGILVKLLLRVARDSEDADFKRIADSTRLVVFLSTPHTGATLANVINHIPGASNSVALLANETGFLEDLNQQYRTYVNGKAALSTVVYYEKFKTGKVTLVVTRESADPGVSGTHPIAVDKDHIGICKPADRDDVVYLGIKRHIGNLMRSVSSSQKSASETHQSDEDYSTHSNNDRRDLLQKLVDSGREYEYDIANDAQNKFAQRFARTGLFSSARADHERLLSEVETRFILHVYHPLICSHAEDQQVRVAIQSSIIDPLVAQKLGGTAFTAKDVMNALYYLTEQCHIRWDASQ